jgi:hypothetical protein
MDLRFQDKTEVHNGRRMEGTSRSIPFLKANKTEQRNLIFKLNKKSFFRISLVEINSESNDDDNNGIKDSGTQKRNMKF